MALEQFGVFLSIIYFQNNTRVFYFYQNSIDQYFSILVSILLLVGSYFIGKSIANKWLSDFRLGTSFFNFHYVLLGNIIVNIFIQYLILFGYANSFNIKTAGIILILFGIFSLYNERKNIATNSYSYFLQLIKSNYSIKLIVLLLLGFFLIALAPITNADSLDYHIGIPLSILKNGHFVWQPTWFHQGLSGIGENSILLSLVLNAEQFPTLLQVASIFSILGLFFYNEEGRSLTPKGYRSLLILIFLSVPVLLFLSSSPKPQLAGIALSSFLFVNIIFKKIKLTLCNLFIIFILLFYLIAIKLNFIFSSFVLIIAFTIESKKYIIKYSSSEKLKALTIILLCFIFVLGPIVYYKSLLSGLDLLSYLYPIPKYYPGQQQFLDYLKNYDDVKLFFPLSLILPSSFGVYSMILGFNLLIVIFLLFKNKIASKYIFYVLLLCILSYLLGQRTSRFYFEPLIWLLLLINLYSKRHFNSKYLKYTVFAVTAMQLSILLFSSYSLTSGVISKSQREKVLTSKANGYTLAKWVNFKLPDTARILIDHRSLAFFNQKVYSSDWVNYIENNSGQDKFYTDYLKKEKVKYLLIIGDKQKDSKLFSYCDSLVYGPFIGQVATRNPLNSGKKYSAWIYTSKF
jgi:hypothetical protein